METEEKKKYPWNKSRTEKAPEPVNADVYAGPEFFAPQGPPPQPPMMCVYAGPEFFNPRPDAAVPAGTVGPSVEIKPTVYCPECGMPAVHTDRFCRNCGARLPEKNGDA